VSEVVVDELDQARGKKAPARDDDIPDIDIGEAENLGDMEHSRTPESERRVMVDPDQHDEGFHGEEPADLTEEERATHAKFEAARKKHYEMRNVKNLLG
jgi:protein phosphatase inhibitor 2